MKLSATAAELNSDVIGELFTLFTTNNLNKETQVKQDIDRHCFV